MTLPTILPAWIPWWVQLLLLVLAVLFALAFLMMPFTILGVRGRLDQIEAQLDDIQADLRTLAARLPDSTGGRPLRAVDRDDPDRLEPRLRR